MVALNCLHFEQIVTAALATPGDGVFTSGFKPFHGVYSIGVYCSSFGGVHHV